MRFALGGSNFEGRTSSVGAAMDSAARLNEPLTKSEQKWLETRRAELEEATQARQRKLTPSSFTSAEFSYTIEDVRRGYEAVGYDVPKIIKNFLIGATLKDAEQVEKMIRHIAPEEADRKPAATTSKNGKRAVSIGSSAVDLPKCGVCLLESKHLFSAPCHIAHLFCVACIYLLFISSNRKVKCPICRAKFYTPETIAEEKDSNFDFLEMTQALEESARVESTAVLCSTCETAFAIDEECVLCDSMLCDKCVIKDSTGLHQQIYCAPCLRFYHSLKTIHKKQINGIVKISEFNSCLKCCSVTCHHCEVSNDADVYCVKCVDSMSAVFISNKADIDCVLELMSKSDK